MKPIDYLIIAIIAAILGAALWYIRRARKKGNKCIGCPNSATCPQHCHCEGKTRNNPLQ